MIATAGIVSGQVEACRFGQVVRTVLSGEMISIASEVAMVISIVIVIHAYLALEVWTLHRGARRDAAVSRSRATDLSAIKPTPLEPLRLPSLDALAPTGARLRVALVERDTHLKYVSR